MKSLDRRPWLKEKSLAVESGHPVVEHNEWFSNTTRAKFEWSKAHHARVSTLRAFRLDQFLNNINEYGARRNTAGVVGRRGGGVVDLISVWNFICFYERAESQGSSDGKRERVRTIKRERSVLRRLFDGTNTFTLLFPPESRDLFVPKRIGQISRTNVLSTLQTREIAIL